MLTLTLITSALLNIASAPPETIQIAYRCEKLTSGKSVCIIEEETLDKLIESNNGAHKKLQALLDTNRCKNSEVLFNQ